jgi:hypothetical protein
MRIYQKYVVVEHSSELSQQIKLQVAEVATKKFGYLDSVHKMGIKIMPFTLTYALFALTKPEGHCVFVCHLRNLCSVFLSFIIQLEHCKMKIL